MNRKFALFNLSLFLMEAVFAIEVTASIVIAPGAIRSLGLPQESAGWIVNSYLYMAFSCMALVYAARRFVVRYISAAKVFYIGIWLFVAGNLMCWIPGGASQLFTGRIIQGIGGALAMTGELWAACEYYREKITIPLFWAECGSAIGVVIGPALGGFIASIGSEGWRILFMLNAVIGIATVLGAWAALRGRTGTKEAGIDEPFRLSGWFVWLVLIQCAVAALTVGAEFLMSDYIQVKLNQSSRFVGLLAVLASIGSIAGSKWMAQYNRSFVKYAQISLGVLIVVHIGLVATLFWANIFLAILPILFIGICMGVANVATYAEIAEKVKPAFFLPATLVYLIAMQIGNAVGVQTVSLTEGRGWTLLMTEIITILVTLVPVLLVLGIIRFRKRSLQPADPA